MLAILACAGIWLAVALSNAAQARYVRDLLGTKLVSSLVYTFGVAFVFLALSKLTVLPEDTRFMVAVVGTLVVHLVSAAALNFRANRKREAAEKVQATP